MHKGLGAFAMRVALSLIAGVACTGRAQSLTGTAAAMRWVDQGKQNFQAYPLTAAAAVLESCVQDPQSGFDCAYHAARAYLYLSYVLDLAGHRDQARAFLGPGIRWAKEAVVKQPGSARAHGLLANLYGREILLGHAFTALRYGPMAADETDKAVALAPKDPEVLDTEAFRCLYAPALFGGNALKAQAYLEQSLQIKDSDFTRYFLALALQKRGLKDQARAQLLKAKVMNPNNALVNVELVKMR